MPDLKTLIYNLFLVCLVITAGAVVLSKNLLNAIIIFSIFNLVMVVLFLFLQAPDVAMAEAIIGLGLTTALYIIAIGRTQENE